MASQGSTKTTGESEIVYYSQVLQALLKGPLGKVKAGSKLQELEHVPL